METLKTAFILSALLVCYSDARGSKEVYQINIDERGTRFNETVEINDKEKNVVYTVPEHNGLVGSEILFDYKTGYFATRIPKFKECYIQRIPKGYPSPALVRKNLEQYQVFKEGKSIVPVKTIKNAVMKGRRINPRELSSSLSAFCDDFVSYEAIQINDQKLFPTKRSEKNGNVWQKRAFHVIPLSVNVGIPKKDGTWVTISLNTCKKLLKYQPELKEGGCETNPDSWEYHCHARTSSCMYTAKCRLVKVGEDVGAIRCEEKHFFTGWTCCDVKCEKR